MNLFCDIAQHCWHWRLLYWAGLWHWSPFCFHSSQWGRDLHASNFYFPWSVLSGFLFKKPSFCKAFLTLEYCFEPYFQINLNNCNILDRFNQAISEKKKIIHIWGASSTRGGSLWFLFTKWLYINLIFMGKWQIKTLFNVTVYVQLKSVKS